MSRYGWVIDDSTGAVLRPATRGELTRSLLADTVRQRIGRTEFVTADSLLSPMQRAQADAVTRRIGATR